MNPPHHLKLVRLPPEHDAVHPDGSLPILQGRFPCQVHKFLWADHMLIILERNTEVQDLLSLTQVWWNCSTAHSPVLLQHQDFTGRNSMALPGTGLSTEHFDTACHENMPSGQWPRWRPALYLIFSMLQPPQKCTVCQMRGQTTRRTLVVYSPTRNSKSLIHYSLSDMHLLSHQ